MRVAGDLQSLERLDPGDHVCWVVSDGREYDAVATAYAADGDRWNDKVVFFGPGPGRHRDGRRARRTFVDPRSAFLGGASFDPDAMYEAFRSQVRSARDEGYRTLRVLADMDWLVADRPSPDELLAFELLLDEVVGETGACVVCAYRDRTFGHEEIDRVRSVHPLNVGSGREGFQLWNVGEGVWALAGEIDLANVDAFEASLTALARDRSWVRLSLGDLRFIDVMAMTTLASVARSFPDTRLSIAGASAVFRRCWSLLDYDSDVPTVELVS